MHVSNIKDYETMEKTINEIYLNTFAQGEFTFTTEQMAQITEIAWQCPLKSAAAVYKARGMYAIAYPYTRFDNYSICATQGLQYRMAQAEQTQQKAEEVKVLLVFPNPSSGMINIQLSGNNNPAFYKIINSLGQQLYNWQNQEELQTVNLATLGFSSGVYYIEAQIPEGKTYRQKFIYQKP